MFNFYLVILILSLIQESYGFNNLGLKLNKNAVAYRQFSRPVLSNTLSMRWGLKPKGDVPQPNVEEGVALRDTVPFELRGFSLPLVVFSVGVLLTTSSFAGFFLNDGDGDGAISSLGFVYGIPVFLIGLSLWYAEIPPVIVESNSEGDAAYEELATDTMMKIKQDVTRHRYGDDAHLDSTLESLGLKLPQRKFPRFQTIRQSRTPEGELSFSMVFESLETPYQVWNDPDRVRRYDTFFGPGVKCFVKKEDAEKRLVSLTMITTSKGEPIVESPAATTTDTDTTSVTTEETDTSPEN